MGKGGALPPAGEAIEPSDTDQVRRLRVRYAKRGRMRFASHRDIARTLERALRRAGIPVASSQGFTPHPKVSYAGAAPTGAASEAEYLELTLTEPWEAEQTRDRLDAAMPEGLDIVEVGPAGQGHGGGLTDSLEASLWRIELPGAAVEDVRTAVAAFLAAERVEVERTTKKGRRAVDARAAVARIDAADTGAAACRAALELVVRHEAPTVRPEDVMAALHQVADLAPPASPRVTRLAQGPVAQLAAPPGREDDTRLDAAEGGSD